MELVPFKEIPGGALALSTMRGYNEKMIVCNPDDGPRQILTFWHLIPVFPVSRTVRNQYPLLMIHLAYGTLLEQPEQTKKL